jgi:hypothetical protein
MNRAVGARLFLAAVIAAAVVGVAAPAQAADPPAGTVGPDQPTTTWKGAAPLVDTSGPDGCPPADPAGTACDHFLLRVDVDSGYWKASDGGALVTITWAHPTDNFDLYVFEGSAPPKQVGASKRTRTTRESVLVPRAAGAYEVRVVPVKVSGHGYTGGVALVTRGQAGSPSGGGSGSSPNSYSPSTDQANFYWREQQDVLIPGTGSHARLPNPQAPDTLAVAVQSGELDKMSSIRFDLAARGLTPGSTVTQFVMTLAEGFGQNQAGSRPDAVNEFNVEKAEVQACLVLDGWASSSPDADLWKESPDGPRPKYDQSACAQGKRDASDPAKPMWTFDLSAVASSWGQDPFTNHGLMLVGVPPKDKNGPEGSWQVNFKIPVADNPATPDDEYKATQYRAAIDMAFQQGGVAPFGPPPPYAAPPMSDFGASSATGATEAGPAGGTPQQPLGSRPIRTVPRIPWYAWALMPFGLAALIAVKGAVFEAAGGTRSDGVIAAIRARNADRAGAASAAATTGPSPPVHPLRSAASWASRAVAGLVGRGRR